MSLGSKDCMKYWVGLGIYSMSRSSKCSSAKTKI